MQWGRYCHENLSIIFSVTFCPETRHSQGMKRGYLFCKKHYKIVAQGPEGGGWKGRGTGFHLILVKNPLTAHSFITNYLFIYSPKEFILHHSILHTDTKIPHINMGTYTPPRSPPKKKRNLFSVIVRIYWSGKGCDWFKTGQELQNNYHILKKTY